MSNTLYLEYFFQDSFVSILHASCSFKHSLANIQFLLWSYFWNGYSVKTTESEWTVILCACVNADIRINWFPVVVVRRDRDPPTPQLGEAEFEEILSRNKTVSSSAISRAVQDASSGMFDSRIVPLHFQFQAYTRFRRSSNTIGWFVHDRRIIHLIWWNCCLVPHPWTMPLCRPTLTPKWWICYFCNLCLPFCGL